MLSRVPDARHCERGSNQFSIWGQKVFLASGEAINPTCPVSRIKCSLSSLLTRSIVASVSESGQMMSLAPAMFKREPSISERSTRRPRNSISPLISLFFW
jgi:hypothetical protein